VQFEDPSITLKTIMDRNETINIATLDVYAAKTLKLNVTEAALGYYAGVLCWRIAYKVTYDRDTWDTELWNVGPFYKSGGTLLPYKYKGVQIVGNLEDDGTMRAMTSTPLTLTFQDKRAIDFSLIRTS
jgi:hypothetical protein